MSERRPLRRKVIGCDSERDWLWLVSFRHGQITRKFQIHVHVRKAYLSFLLESVNSLMPFSFDLLLKYNVLMEVLFKSRLDFTVVSNIGKLNLSFRQKGKNRPNFSRTLNSTVWPLLRNGSTNFVCTYVLWQLHYSFDISGSLPKTFLELIKEIS